jgi:sodium/hydrogen antiporter
VYLAIVLAATGIAIDGLAAWFAVDVLWRIVAGIAVGVGVGRAVAWLVFRFTDPGHVLDGFVALALTLVTYGLAEVAHGYGFIAVFVAALVFRDVERDSAYHRSLHEFGEQAETLLMAVLLVGLGAAVVHGMLAPLTGAGVVIGVGAVALIRPLAGIVATSGLGLHRAERGVVAVFGIRGIGTFYYLAYGLNHGAFDESTARVLWAVAGWIVILSIVVHGATAARAIGRVMRGPNV